MLTRKRFILNVFRARNTPSRMSVAGQGRPWPAGRWHGRSTPTAFSVHMGSLGDPIWPENAVDSILAHVLVGEPDSTSPEHARAPETPVRSGTCASCHIRTNAPPFRQHSDVLALPALTFVSAVRDIRAEISFGDENGAVIGAHCWFLNTKAETGS